MNPLLNSEAIAAVYEEDPEGAKADYGAQFRSDISSYISPEVVDGCIAYGCHERAPVEGSGLLTVSPIWPV